MRLQRMCMLVYCFPLVVCGPIGCGEKEKAAPVADERITEGLAIAEIRNLGGLVERDDTGSAIAVFLSFTEVTDAELVHLKGLTNLKELELRDTQVTGEGFKHLKGLTNLEMLDLGLTQVTVMLVADPRVVNSLTAPGGKLSCPPTAMAWALVWLRE